MSILLTGRLLQIIKALKRSLVESKAWGAIIAVNSHFPSLHHDDDWYELPRHGGLMQDRWRRLVPRPQVMLQVHPFHSPQLPSGENKPKCKNELMQQTCNLKAPPRMSFLKVAQAEGQTWDLVGFGLFSLLIAAPLTTRLLHPQPRTSFCVQQPFKHRHQLCLYVQKNKFLHVLIAARFCSFHCRLAARLELGSQSLVTAAYPTLRRWGLSRWESLLVVDWCTPNKKVDS